MTVGEEEIIQKAEASQENQELTAGSNPQLEIAMTTQINKASVEITDAAENNYNELTFNHNQELSMTYD